MSSQREAYNNYLKQFEGQKEPEKGSTEYLKHALLIDKRGGKVEGSGRYEATYRLFPDGRIGELYHSGMLSYLWIWANREAYDAYRTPMPFGVYHEF